MMLPLLFLPGMMCDARPFGPQIAALGRDLEASHVARRRAGQITRSKGAGLR